MAEQSSEAQGTQTFALSEGQLNEFVVRRLRIEYELDLGDIRAADDFLLLETSDGSWWHTAELRGLPETARGWVEVSFPHPPDGSKLSLYQARKDGSEPLVIFQDLTVEEILASEELGATGDPERALDAFDVSESEESGPAEGSAPAR